MGSRKKESSFTRRNCKMSSIPADFPDAAAILERDPNMFVMLQRNKNANTVLYTVNIVDGKIDPSNPVKVYWIMYTKGGSTEGLNMVERNSAYGVSVSPAEEDGAYIVRVAAMKERPFKVYLGEDGKPIAVCEINGVESQIQQIYVQAKEGGWGLPKVDFVELVGLTLGDNPEKVIETVKK